MRPRYRALHEAELLIAKEINKHMPAVKCSECCPAMNQLWLLRVERLATGKKTIKIGGAYHGWSDQMVYGLKIPGSLST